jgi:hypothetical protein
VFENTLGESKALEKLCAAGEFFVLVKERSECEPFTVNRKRSYSDGDASVIKAKLSHNVNKPPKLNFPPVIHQSPSRGPEVRFLTYRFPSQGTKNTR